jgi:hypothetical protein
MSASGYPIGARVRLLAPNELFTGEVGTVAEHITDDEGQLIHYVRFRPDEPDYPHNFSYHLADELEPE